jgi:hypothetical protein
MTSRLSVVVTSVVFTMVLAAAAALHAQEPAPGARQGGRGGGRAGGAPQAAAPAPLFFKETWKAGSAAVAATQAVVANPDLTIAVYGKAANQPEVNEEGGVAHVWTGLCAPACAVMLKNKASFADLTGRARMKWFAKVSGFHEIRPVVKLADGTWLVGNFADSYTYDYHEVEFHFAEVRWMRLDIDSLTTKGALLDKVDLSKVDEIGFVDLTPGSGHGLGGYSDIGWMEVYGKPVPR